MLSYNRIVQLLGHFSPLILAVLAATSSAMGPHAMITGWVGLTGADDPWDGINRLSLKSSTCEGSVPPAGRVLVSCSTCLVYMTGHYSCPIQASHRPTGSCEMAVACGYEGLLADHPSRRTVCLL